MNAQKFLDNFGYIANAPQGVQRLREMIYNLAITGDLSQQRPEDRDGQSLLEQITETRRQLIERKSFKRSPKLENFLDTFATELPNIPGSWVWTRLVDIGEINHLINQVEDDMLASFAVYERHPNETYSGDLNESRCAFQLLLRERAKKRTLLILLTVMWFWPKSHLVSRTPGNLL